MAEKKTLSKQKLHITKQDIDVSYAQGAKFLDRVQAENLSLPEGDPLHGKSLRMTIFKQDLKEFIRGKEIIIADVEETARPDSEYGPDRTIVQVYDDKGDPVSRKKGGPGGGGYRRSLEEDLVMESMKQMGAFLLASFTGATGLPWNITAEEFERLARKYWKAVERGLDTAINPPAAPAGNAPDASRNAKSGGDKGDKVQSDMKTGDDHVKHVGDLLTRASKLTPPVTREEIVAAFQIGDPSEIGDLDGAWKKIQAMSTEKGAAKLFD